MARFTAPSLWLPGFDPEPVDATEPLASCLEAQAQAADLSAEPREELPETATTAPHHTPWRVAGVVTESAPRTLWPALRQADLYKLGGTVAKFDANVDAIATLRHVECHDRAPFTVERSRLVRFTAPSLWLPGFDPEPVDATEPLASCLEAQAQAADLSAEPREELPETATTAPHHTPWRVAGVVTESAPRTLWPALRQADLYKLGGTVAKFDANVDAIATLRHVECQDRPPFAAERSRLLRYTGLGGLGRLCSCRSHALARLPE